MLTPASLDPEGRAAPANEDADLVPLAALPLPPEGLVAFYVKDDPFEDFSRFAVNIARVEIHRAGATIDEGWTELPDAERTLDLLRFRHPEARAHLVTAVVPSGQYDAVRLTFTGAWGTLKQNATMVDVPVRTPTTVEHVNFTVGHGVVRLVNDVSLHRSVLKDNGTYAFDPDVAFVRVRYVLHDGGVDVPAPVDTPPAARTKMQRKAQSPA